MNLRNSKYLLFFLLLFAVPVAMAAGDGKKNNKLNKTAGEPVYTHFNINQISTWLKNDGESDISPSGNSGFVYPKGSNKTAIFQSGFLWGGKVDGQIRVGGSVYRQGIVGGKILNSGVPWDQLQAEDPDADNVRIYRVRPDWADGNIQAEINDGEGSESEIRAAYEKDWNEWPAADGAPFSDLDSNGVYDPTIDIPGVPGADQTIWFVANDTDPDQTDFMYGSPPMGIEMQATIWGYNQAGPLGSMLFRKYKIINKSSSTFQDMYVSMWNDPDLGDATDDFVGCDTTLSMTFVYNANAEDATYGSQPAAAGFDFFQGPIVPGEATDSARFNNQIFYGKKNLPMTAHYFFINSDPIYTDPTQGVYNTGTLQWYNLLQGKVGSTGEVFPIPGGGNSPFALSGDPLTQTGWVDGIQHPAGDRRAGMASGPFTMAPADTQEIVVAEVAAMGSDNLGSVSLLKNYDLKAQEAYDNFFQLPAPPRAPLVVATPLDEAVLLNWGGNIDRFEETEIDQNEEDGFAFEGYNVYQLSDRVGTQKVKIATFDLNNGVKAIVGKDIDPKTGAEISVVQQAGNDVGVQHFINITRDYINNTTLANGRRYYYAVTAYSYNPDPNAVPNNLENPLSIITVTPASSNPGVSWNGTPGDSITVNRQGGASDGSVVALVVDPTSLTGHNYRVNFAEEEGAITWSLTDMATGQVRLANQGNQLGDGIYPTVDGIMVKPIGPPIAVNSYSFTPSADRWLTGVNAGLDVLGGGLGVGINFFGSNVTAAQYVKVEIRFRTNADGQKAYRYVRGATPSYSYQDYTPQHFTVWDVTSQPERQLAVGYVEQNGVPAANSLWEPTTASSDREYLFIYDSPYTEEPQDFFMNTNAYAQAGEFPTLYAMWPLLRDGRTFNPQDGQVMTITPNFPNTPNDIFTFTAPAVDSSMEAAKNDIEKINVFPNPYYGVNPEELNKYQRFVTFNHLPTKATIRIFNLAGQLVRTIEKNDVSQFQRWDLQTQDGLPVASGLYIVYVDMPELGKTKILKAAIIQEQQILDRY